MIAESRCDPTTKRASRFSLKFVCIHLETPHLSLRSSRSLLFTCTPRLHPTASSLLAETSAPLSWLLALPVKHRTGACDTMASHLESLPAELLLLVVEHIPRPSDLEALCLTSRAMRVPATTLLYHDVFLDVEFKDCLSESNPGLYQIRKLSFEYDEETPISHKSKELATVLKSLPKNTLRQLDVTHSVSLTL